MNNEIINATVNTYKVLLIGFLIVLNIPYNTTIGVTEARAIPIANL